MLEVDEMLIILEAVQDLYLEHGGVGGKSGSGATPFSGVFFTSSHGENITQYLNSSGKSKLS
jgi:hypothetical protein